jgi:cytoskeletal protein RodZ
MLPGFRFLFAAVLLTVSLVVFGLGAAALLRSAHQEFATIPTRRAAPTVFAQPPVEAPPTLAMLRVEAPAPTPETVAPPVVSVTSAAEQVPPIAAPAEPEKIALPETAAPLSTLAAPTVEMTAPVAATPKPEVATKSEATKIEEREPLTTVAVAPATSVEPVAAPPPEPAVVPAPAAATEVAAGPQPTATLTDDDARLSSTKIAMLGGPPIDTESVPLPKAKPAAEPAKKIVKKRIVVKKRRVAAKPIAAAAPQPTDPFGLPVAR